MQPVVSNQSSDETEENLDDPMVTSNADFYCAVTQQQNKSIKASSPFTAHFNEVLNSIKGNFNNTFLINTNPLQNEGYISFLTDQFMPYIFLWASFTLRGLEFEQKTTHLTDSSIENFIMCRKNLVPEPLMPAKYLTQVVYPILGQCKPLIQAEETEGEETDIVKSKEGWNKKFRKVPRLITNTYKQKTSHYYTAPAMTLPSYNVILSSKIFFFYFNFSLAR